VVTGNIPPYSIAAGNPVKILRKRFSDKVINKLLNIKWWHWDIEKIIENVHYLQSPMIEEFIKTYEK